jgi:hypothetical protein
MDSTAQTATRDSKMINELLSGVSHGFDSPNSPLGLRYHQRTGVTGDAWIRQPKQPLGTRKSSTNCCQGDAWIRHPKQPLGTPISSTNWCHG